MVDQKCAFTKFESKEQFRLEDHRHDLIGQLKLLCVCDSNK